MLINSSNVCTMYTMLPESGLGSMFINGCVFILFRRKILVLLLLGVNAINNETSAAKRKVGITSPT